MTKEIERSGIPIVQVTNLSKIAEGIGSNRIFRGNSVLHVFGDPSLPRENELEYRENAVMQALKMLKIVPEEGKSIVKEIA